MISVRMTLAEIHEEAMAGISQEAIAQGKADGLAKGIVKSNRPFVEAMLKTRFGSVDEELAAIVESIASLPVEESTPLLLNASRAELFDFLPNKTKASDTP
jgi:flagellar biosynthesis/type III secretory pathway protein FliH